MEVLAFIVWGPEHCLACISDKTQCTYAYWLFPYIILKAAMPGHTATECDWASARLTAGDLPDVVANVSDVYPSTLCHLWHWFQTHGNNPGCPCRTFKLSSIEISTKVCVSFSMTENERTLRQDYLSQIR